MKQEMGDKRDIRPFIYGGVASIIAEFGKFFFFGIPNSSLFNKIYFILKNE